MAEFKKTRVCGLEVPIILIWLLLLLFVATVGTTGAVAWKWWQVHALIPNPNAAPRPVDLSRHYNADLTNAWHFRGGRGSATLRDVPQGVQEFVGIPFEVRRLIQLASARTGGNPSWPEQVTDIPLGLRCRSLHFLHATGWVARDGTPIGSYVVHYAAGSTVAIPIVYGQHLREWHGRSDRVQEITDGVSA